MGSQRVGHKWATKYTHTYYIHSFCKISVMPRKVFLFVVWNVWTSPVAQQWRIYLQYRRCRRHSFSLWVRKIPWRRRKWQPAPVFLLRKSNEQMSLWGWLELDMSRWLSTHTHTEYLGCIYIIYNKITIILFDILWWYIIIDIKFFSITNQQKAK